MARSAASLAAALVLVPGCGSDDAGLFGNSSGSATTTATGTGGSGGTGAGAGGATSGTSMTSGSMAAGTGGTSPAGTGGTGGGCAQVTWYCDRDQDGYGDPTVSVTACDPPVSDAKCMGPYVASNTDCGPGDMSAHPDQMSYFSTPVIAPAPTLAFDYNCDGQEEKDPSQLYNGGMNLNCGFNDCFSPVSPRGFGPNAQCGQKAEYYQCNFSFGTCMLSMTTPPDPLRCR